ncbi:TetR/AcrR family transcriptional regulator [Phytoactinopolyspora alkaliphila]|uniref:TetR/AcrR family transcriptional regulator n=1 Tax=Phytoactinopolyspora alkaliphila TaxID=1783498 RepID=A0A6N9YU25_9ACTN|nr:TetR/AcrR family transcriptional regulator [Phytoactinopolyspora alkaliphila]NED98475.1 TetR/AcrR family transcriptional regulator [Phytoactinopolyspora alkaliphila]
MGEALTPAGRRTLDAAAELFYTQGIHAVGVDAVASAAGITKKTLYACFGSKDRLVAAYLKERDERWRQWLREQVDEPGGPARDQILATFDALAAWAERENSRGCGFVNALAELPAADHPARAVIAEQKRWMLGYLTGLAAAAGAEPPEALGRTLFLLHEGASVAASIEAVPDAARHARSVAADLVPDGGMTT